jgi:HlyD family secretion protein
LKTKIIIAVQLLLIIVVSTLLVLNFKNGKEDPAIVLYGNIDIRQVDCAFKVQGRLKSVFVEEGDPIHSGDLLAALDPVSFEEDLEIALAEYKRAQTVLMQADAQYERRHQASTEAVSVEELEDAYFEKLSLEAAHQAAKARVAVAMTALDDTQLFAPTSGTLITRIKEPGSILAIGQPAVTISIDDPVWVRAYVDEPDLGKIYPGMPAEIIIDTPGSKRYIGKIGFISPVAEFTPKTVETTRLRTDLVYRLRIIVTNSDRYLRQGMPVTVRLLNPSFGRHDE